MNGRDESDEEGLDGPDTNVSIGGDQGKDDEFLIGVDVDHEVRSGLNLDEEGGDGLSGPDTDRES